MTHNKADEFVCLNAQASESTSEFWKLFLAFDTPIFEDGKHLFSVHVMKLMDLKKKKTIK